MQTFLPYPNFRLSAHVLDFRRLGKQRVECVQILRMIAGIREGGSHRFHPATLMWRGYGPALCLYQDAILQEWTQRGYENNLLSPRTAAGCDQCGIPREWATAAPEMPPWLGLDRLHASHRAALKFKDPHWYAQFCWDEPAVLDYFWPGLIPSAGDSIIAPDGSVHLVTEGASGGAVVALSSDGQKTQVSLRDLYARVWQRGVANDM